MVKRKRSSRPRQVQQVPKSKSTNKDKRKRLDTPNGQRRSTDHASVPLGGGIATLIDAMSQMLDRRIRFRLPIVLAGAMLAGGRRTAASWFRCAGVLDDWDRFYDLLQTIGKNAALMMLPLLTEIVRRFGPDQHGCWKIGLDDCPRNDLGPVSKVLIFTTTRHQALATVSGSMDTVGSAYRSCCDIRGSELLPFRCFPICTFGRSASRR